MKEVTMFMQTSCPHCQNARRMIAGLRGEHPEYKDIKIKEIDEIKEAELADSFDYYYVPTFYVDGVKLHEGVPTLEAVKRVLDSATA